MEGRLPSWRPGPRRDAILEFLDAAHEVPVPERFACFDNDGTLWCERPRYIQFEFFLEALRGAIKNTPDLADTPEFAALIAHDQTALDELGLKRVALALAGLFKGRTAEEYRSTVRGFMASARHPELKRPMDQLRYRPMLELIGELRALAFTVALVSGGGVEFVRSVSDDLYGIPSELVAGTRIAYDFRRQQDGAPLLTRTARVDGDVDEGPAKVVTIQSQLGRRPILAAGNSGGDREMLEWAAGSDGPSLAILVDHDDADREYAYLSKAASFSEDRPITEVGADLGWTVVSMKEDWADVFT